MSFSRSFANSRIPVALLALTLSACGSVTDLNGRSARGVTGTPPAEKEQGEFSLLLPTAAELGISITPDKVVVKIVNKPAGQLVKLIETKFIVNDPIKSTLPSGTYGVSVDLYSASDLQYSGAAEVKILAGQVSALDIELQQASGELIVKARIKPAIATTLTGSFGGDQASLVLTTTGGKLELNCGGGMINQPVMLPASGKIDVKGTITQAASAKDLKNPLVPSSVLFHISVIGDAMELSWNALALDGSTDKSFMIPLKLRRNQTANLVRCL